MATLRNIISFLFKPLLGGMAKDIDPRYLKNGDFVDSLNNRSTTTVGATTADREVVIGNILAYTLPFVSSQDKMYRIYLDSSQVTPTARTLEFFDGNGLTIGTSTYTPTSNDLAATYADTITAITGTLGGGYTPGPLVQTSANSGYFSFDFTAVFFWDYTIMLTGAVDEPLPIIIQEAIDASLSGQLVTIGSYDLLGDLFVWSTNQHNIPSVLRILDATNDGTGLIRITLEDTTDLPDYTHSIISGVIGTTEANGNWISTLVDATHIDLQGSAFANAFQIRLNYSNLAGGTFAAADTITASNGAVGTVVGDNGFDSLTFTITSGNWFDLAITDIDNGTGVTADVESVSGGNLTINTVGLGEIGVAVQDENTQIWTYTTLIRSREFNFNTKHQIKTFCERNNFLKSLYYVDGKNNVPRVTYYTGAYVADGALSYINPLGIYEYGSIAQEIQLILNTSTFDVAWVNQFQTGGGIEAGNWRYAVRMLTDNFSPTMITDPTNPVNVCVENAINLNSASLPLIGGNDSFTVTGKQNILEITGIIPNLFKYVELIGLYYVDGSPVPIGYVIKRDLLTQEPTQQIVHTGLETGVQSFDVANFSAVFNDILTAENIAGVDNHLVLANTTSSAPIDLSDFFATITHTIKRDTIDGVRIPVSGTYRSGEYITPFNVYGKMGYMFNEIYAVYAKAKLKTGFVTQSFWVDYIRIDTLVTNIIANPTDDRRVGAALASYDLTDASGNDVYVPYIELNMPNVDFLIDGVPARDLIDEIIFERPEMIDDYIEVRADGVAAMSADALISFETGSPYDANIDIELTPAFATTPPLIEFPFISGEWFYDINGTSATPNNVDYNYNAYAYQIALWGFPANYVTNRKFFAFYSPEYLFVNSGFALVAGDSIINYGSPGELLVNATGVQGVAGGCAIYSSLREFNGFVNTNTYQAPSVANPPSGVNIVAGQDVAQGSTVTINAVSFTKNIGLIVGLFGDLIPSASFLYDNPTSPVITTTDDLTDVNGAGNTDFGVYRVQHYRFKGSGKFGNVTSVKTVPTGLVYKITSDTPSAVTGLAMFGGDCFTQKSYIKHVMPQTSNADISGNNYAKTGFGGGFSFYSQNRVNTQMRNTDITQSNQNRYPAITNSAWLESIDSDVVPEYNTGYNIENGVIADSVFDPNQPVATDQPAHIPYSDLKPENSVVDNYRTFLPLNFRDLQLSHGQITEIMNVNGELMSWQDRHFEMQYFNTTGMLVASNTDVIMGNAGIMTQKGRTLSTYGSKHRYGLIKGKTKAGKDVVYWMSSDYRRVMRFEPSDGTVCISDVHGMSSFFGEFLRFAGLYDTPADGLGIHGVWNDRNTEAIWTVRAWKTGIAEWTETPFGESAYKIIFTGLTGAFSSGENISGDMGGSGVITLTANSNNYMFVVNASQFFQVGEVITGASSGATATATTVVNIYSSGSIVQDGSSETFEEFPDFYESLVSGNTDQPSDGVLLYPPTWKYLWNDPRVYNIYTVVFNETTNKFDTFYSFHPKIYLTWKNTYLSPRPKENEGRTFEHGRGEFLVWYSDQVESGYYVFVINAQMDDIKRFLAVRFRTSKVPVRVEVEGSMGQKTFMVAADFTFREMNYDAGIRMDTTTSSTGAANNEDTSFIIGDYCLVKMFFDPREYQKLVEMSMPSKIRPRRNQS